jgi:hypothetical protein
MSAESEWCVRSNLQKAVALFALARELERMIDFFCSRPMFFSMRSFILPLTNNIEWRDLGFNFNVNTAQLLNFRFSPTKLTA